MIVQQRRAGDGTDPHQKLREAAHQGLLLRLAAWNQHSIALCPPVHKTLRQVNLRTQLTNTIGREPSQKCMIAIYSQKQAVSDVRQQNVKELNLPSVLASERRLCRDTMIGRAIRHPVV
jgi:hypothetical protein